MATLDKTVYKQFNKAVKALIKELVAHFPDDDMMKLISCSFAIMKRLSKKKPQKYFFKVVEDPHGHAIDKRDTNYFQSDTFTSPSWPALVSFIKEKLRVIDRENLDKLFDHLAELIKCSKQCQEYREQKGGNNIRASASLESDSEELDD